MNQGTRQSAPRLDAKASEQERERTVRARWCEKQNSRDLDGAARFLSRRGENGFGATPPPSPRRSRRGGCACRRGCCRSCSCARCGRARVGGGGGGGARFKQTDTQTRGWFNSARRGRGATTTRRARPTTHAERATPPPSTPRDTRDAPRALWKLRLDAFAVETDLTASTTSPARRRLLRDDAVPNRTHVVFCVTTHRFFSWSFMEYGAARCSPKWMTVSNCSARRRFSSSWYLRHIHFVSRIPHTRTHTDHRQHRRRTRARGDGERRATQEEGKGRCEAGEGDALGGDVHVDPADLLAARDLLPRLEPRLHRRDRRERVCGRRRAAARRRGGGGAGAGESRGGARQERLSDDGAAFTRRGTPAPRALSQHDHVRWPRQRDREGGGWWRCNGRVRRRDWPGPAERAAE